MKLLSWNIKKGENLEKVIEVIGQESPDIVTLQEVTEYERQGIKTNIASQISEKLGFSFLFFKAFTTDRHIPVFDIGEAILSKTPFMQSRSYELSDSSYYEKNSITEPRILGEAQIPTGKGLLTIYTTHLGYSENFEVSKLRTIQLDNLISHLKPSNCILTGDFNSLPESDEVKKISKIMKNTDKNLQLPTFTDWKDPLKKQYRIDYIFSSPDLATSNFSIIPTEASDHYPLTLEIYV